MRAGFVLAGGPESSIVPDEVILKIAELVREAAGSVTLVGLPERCGHLGLPVLPDAVPSQGPLCGVLTALKATTAEWNLIVACDFSALTIEFLRTLVEQAEIVGRDCLVPVSIEGLEPLCTVYNSRVAPKAARAIEAKALNMEDFVQSLAMAAWPVEDPVMLARIGSQPPPIESPQARAPVSPAGISPPLGDSASHSSPNKGSSHYIEFAHVYKTFDHPILVDVNFHLDAGETLAIIGRSGVGKSVTLGHIMGFIKPDKGRTYVRYQDITDGNEKILRRIRKKVTMVFQSGALFDSLTVAENILFSLELRDDYDAANKEEVVHGLLQIVGLTDFKDTYPADLSTGYKRAVAIARALAAQPECILYDEPTTMVDPIMADHLGELMLRLKTQLQLTGVVVTHDLDLMRRVADKVVVLYQGKSIYFGPVADLEKSPHPHIQEFLAMDALT